MPDASMLGMSTILELIVLWYRNTAIRLHERRIVRAEMFVDLTRTDLR